MSRNLTAAAIQIRCDPHRTKENLAHAEILLEQAAAQGAQLVILPELMPDGYARHPSRSDRALVISDADS